MSLDLRLVAANWVGLGGAVSGGVAIKTAVTFGLLRFTGTRPGTAAEAGVLMSSPSETTLIVLGVATQAQLILPSTAAFWQTVTAIGLTRSEEHTSELQSLMRISYAVFCLKKKNMTHKHNKLHQTAYNK